MKKILIFACISMAFMFNSGCTAIYFSYMRTIDKARGIPWANQSVQVRQNDEVPSNDYQLVGYLIGGGHRYRKDEEKWLFYLKKAAVEKFGADCILIKNIPSNILKERDFNYSSCTVRVYRKIGLNSDLIETKNQIMQMSSPKPIDVYREYEITDNPKLKNKQLGLLETLAKSNVADGCLFYGKAIMKNAEMGQDMDRAVKWYFRAWELGCADSACEIGDAFKQGVVFSRDLEEAEEWYQKAADAGSSHAWGKLASFYLNADEVGNNRNKAIKLLKKGADQGDCECSEKLGLELINGPPFRSYFEEGTGYLWKSMDEDCPDAWRYLLTSMRKKSVSHAWLKKQVVEILLRANIGNANSQYLLGICYQEGFGTPQNAASAFSWVRKAAEGGISEAQADLSNYYESGFGVDRNIDSAVEWIEKAIKNGYVRGYERLEQLKDLQIGKKEGKGP